MNAINENKIKLTGCATLSAPPKRTNLFVDLTIKNATLKGDRYIKDNEDGTEDVIWKLAITPETEITILCENEILTAKKKGSMSQVLRNTLAKLYEQQFAGDEKYKDADDFYQKEMSRIIEKYKNNLI